MSWATFCICESGPWEGVWDPWCRQNGRRPEGARWCATSRDSRCKQRRKMAGLVTRPFIKIVCCNNLCLLSHDDDTRNCLSCPDLPPCDLTPASWTRRTRAKSRHVLKVAKWKLDFLLLTTREAMCGTVRRVRATVVVVGEQQVLFILSVCL